MSIVSEFGRFRGCDGKEPEEGADRSVIKLEGRGSEVARNVVDCVSADCCDRTLSATRVRSWSKNSANLGAYSRISFVLASCRVSSDIELSSSNNDSTSNSVSITSTKRREKHTSPLKIRPFMIHVQDVQVFIFSRIKLDSQ